MKKLLKYLLSLAVIVAFADVADADVGTYAGSESVQAEAFFDSGTCVSTISATEAEFCVPRQVIFANTQQVQSSARRTSTIQRSSLEFAKSGKVINAGIQYFIQNNITVSRSRFADRAHMLFYLGKLII